MDDRPRHPPPVAYMQQQRAALQWHREHQLHLQRQQEPTRASLVVHGEGQTATTRPQGDHPPSSPTVSTPATIIAALHHFLQTLRRDIHARCDRLELQLAQSANNPAPQPPPPIQDDYKAVFAAALVSIHEKLNKIENDLIDVQSVRMLSGSQGGASTSVGASNARLARVETIMNTTVGAIANEMHEMKGRMSNLEHLLEELVEKADDPHAGAAAVARHEMGVMTDPPRPTPEAMLQGTAERLVSSPQSHTRPSLAPISASQDVPRGRILHDANVGTDPPNLSLSPATRNLEGTANATAGISSPSVHSISPHLGPSPGEFAATVKILIEMLTSLVSSGQVIVPSPDITALLQLSGSGFPPRNSSLFQAESPCPSETYSVSPSIHRAQREDPDDLFSKFINQEYHGDKEKGRSSDSAPFSSPPELRPAQWSFESLSLSEDISRGSSCSTEIGSNLTDQSSSQYALKRKRGDLDTCPSRLATTSRRRRLSTSSESFTSQSTTPGPTVNELRARWLSSAQAAVEAIPSTPHSDAAPDPRTCAPTLSSTSTPLHTPAHIRYNIETSDIHQNQDHDRTYDLHGPMPGSSPTMCPSPLFSPRRSSDSNLTLAPSSTAELSQAGHRADLQAQCGNMVADIPPVQQRQCLPEAPSWDSKEPRPLSQSTGKAVDPPTHITVVNPLGELREGNIAYTRPNDPGEDLDTVRRQLDDIEELRTSLARGSSENTDGEEGSTQVDETVGTSANGSELVDDDSIGEVNDARVLTEENVRQLEVISQIEPPHVPSVAGSESGCSSLSSLSSLSSIRSVSTVSNKTARPYADVEEFEEEEPTIHFSPSYSSQSNEPSSISSSKRKRAGTWKSLEPAGKAAASKWKKQSRKSCETVQGPVTLSLHIPSTSSLSESASTSTLTTHVSTKRKSKAKNGATFSKKSKAKSAKKLLKAEATDLSGPPESPYWQVLSGYNGPCEWPEIISEGTSVGDFIQCSCCDSWYHFGCLAVADDDPRTAEGVDLFCPPCELSFTKHGIGRKLHNVVDQHCARPDCSLHFLTASVDQETYFLERVIGRIPCASAQTDNETKPVTKFEDGEFMWLVKWLDYDVLDSTWEPTNTVSMNGGKFIRAFMTTATAEGFDAADPMAYIVLEEGARFGLRRPQWAIPCRR